MSPLLLEAERLQDQQDGLRRVDLSERTILRSVLSVPARVVELLVEGVEDRDGEAHLRGLEGQLHVLGHGLVQRLLPLARVQQLADFFLLEDQLHFPFAHDFRERVSVNSDGLPARASSGIENDRRRAYHLAARHGPTHLGPAYLGRAPPHGRGLPRPPHAARRQALRRVPRGAPVDAALRGLRLPRAPLPQSLPGRCRENRRVPRQPEVLPRGAAQLRHGAHSPGGAGVEPCPGRALLRHGTAADARAAGVDHGLQARAPGARRLTGSRSDPGPWTVRLLDAAYVAAMRSRRYTKGIMPRMVRMVRDNSRSARSRLKTIKEAPARAPSSSASTSSASNEAWKTWFEQKIEEIKRRKEKVKTVVVSALSETIKRAQQEQRTFYLFEIAEMSPDKKTASVGLSFGQLYFILSKLTGTRTIDVQGKGDSLKCIVGDPDLFKDKNSKLRHNVLLYNGEKLTFPGAWYLWLTRDKIQAAKDASYPTFLANQFLESLKAKFVGIEAEKAWEEVNNKILGEWGLSIQEVQHPWKNITIKFKTVASVQQSTYANAKTVLESPVWNVFEQAGCHIEGVPIKEGSSQKRLYLSPPNRFAKPKSVSNYFVADTEPLKGILDLVREEQNRLIAEYERTYPSLKTPIFQEVILNLPCLPPVTYSKDSKDPTQKLIEDIKNAAKGLQPVKNTGSDVYYDFPPDPEINVLLSGSPPTTQGAKTPTKPPGMLENVARFATTQIAAGIAGLASRSSSPKTSV